MANPTRALARHSTNASHHGDLVHELLAIRDRHSGQPSRLLLTEFAARHSLTHRDVDALLVSLYQDGVASPDSATASAEESASKGTVDEDLVARPDGDLAWLFGNEPDPSPLRAADDVVGRALDDLLGDWSRRGGRLTQADVAVLVSARRLSPVQHGELLHLLDDAGVELPDLTDPRPTRRVAESEHELHGDTVGQYLGAIRRYSLIDGSREIELWTLMSQGAAAMGELDESGGDALASDIRRSLAVRVEAGRRAHAELVCANLRLVVSIAKARHYDHCGVEFADRIQDGNRGLMRAADKFDGSKGFKFSTYATWWVRQSIERGIGDRGRIIRVPIHFHERARKVRKAIRKLTAQFGREPSLAEIADATAIEPGQIQAVLDLTQPVASLDGLLGDEGDLQLSDVLVVEEDRDGRADPAEIVAHAMMREDMMRVLSEVLPARAVQILERRFGVGTGDEETLDEIGTAFGVTRERIRQIQNKSLDRLRESTCVASLRAYVVDD